MFIFILLFTALFSTFVIPFSALLENPHLKLFAWFLIFCNLRMVAIPLSAVCNSPGAASC